MLAIVNWQQLSLKERQQRLARATQLGASKQVVTDILETVKAKGDQALLDYSRDFDGVSLSVLKVSGAEINRASVNADELTAIQSAIATITAFYQATMPQKMRINTSKGIFIDRVYRPIQNVGLYVPGGNRTPLVSSLLMQAIPALVAGCPVRVVCTPPNSQGEIDPCLLVAARLCQIETIYPIGGAQAIAAMAYGTETIKKVNKIFGPGNAYVTEAKTQVSMDPKGAAIDMPAGPSEVVIIADNQANPEFVAADLLAQAEHGTDSQVILLCDTHEFAEKVKMAVTKQLETLTRKELIQKSLHHGCLIVASSRSEILAIVNDYAPEHLIINRQDADSWVDDIKNAGSIFLGAYAAVTMGDYVTGSNHVLPTNGYARQYSGLGVNDFLKTISVQSISEEGIETLGDAAYTLALMEGLDAHANAVKIRRRL